jgi:hypothetical protein
MNTYDIIRWASQFHVNGSCDPVYIRNDVRVQVRLDGMGKWEVTNSNGNIVVGEEDNTDDMWSATYDLLMEDPQEQDCDNNGGNCDDYLLEPSCDQYNDWD